MTYFIYYDRHLTSPYQDEHIPWIHGMIVQQTLSIDIWAYDDRVRKFAFLFPQRFFQLFLIEKVSLLFRYTTESFLCTSKFVSISLFGILCSVFIFYTWCITYHDLVWWFQIDFNYIYSKTFFLQIIHLQILSIPNE